MAMESLTAASLLFLVLGTHLFSCEEARSRSTPVIRLVPRSEPTTGCYIVAMADDASEEQLKQAAAIAAKTSDDGKVYGLVKRLKKAFTVKLNAYTLEMVREGRGMEVERKQYINLI